MSKGAARPPRIMRRGMAYGPPRTAGEGDEDADEQLVAAKAEAKTKARLLNAVST